MAGTLKIGGNIIATHAGSEGAGTVTLDSSTLTIGSNTTVQGAMNAGSITSGVTFPAGHVVKTQRYATSSEQTNITATSFNTSKTIGSFAFTPQFASSNILLLASVISDTDSSGAYVFMDFYKNASDVTETANLSGYNHGVCINHVGGVWQSKFLMFLDECSENSTTEKTYKVSARLNASGSGYIGWGSNSPTIVVIQEIAT